MSKNTKPHNSANANAGKLGDEQRVKVLSPSMMVFKRFMRNKLAVTGMIILHHVPVLLRGRHCFPL